MSYETNDNSGESNQRRPKLYLSREEALKKLEEHRARIKAAAAAAAKIIATAEIEANVAAEIENKKDNSDEPLKGDQKLHLPPREEALEKLVKQHAIVLARIKGELGAIDKAVAGIESELNPWEKKNNTLKFAYNAISMFLLIVPVAVCIFLAYKVYNVKLANQNVKTISTSIKIP